MELGFSASVPWIIFALEGGLVYAVVRNGFFPDHEAKFFWHIQELGKASLQLQGSGAGHGSHLELG